jgi:BirA family biotin operon repressor/biotin-[acetyl-CoA-carboxylase] ligase
VLRPPLAPVALGGLSLALAVGTARALDSLGAEAGLKWPNDLEVAGRKLGGILLEMTAEADRTEWVVAGCGVNVVGAPGADFAAVREQVPDVRVPVVAAALLDGIAAAYREFLGAGFPGGLAAAYRARDVLTGRDVIVRDATGALVAAGVAERVADDGSLVVAGQDGTRSVAAGEVTLRSAAR